MAEEYLNIGLAGVRKKSKKKKASKSKKRKKSQTSNQRYGARVSQNVVNRINIGRGSNSEAQQRSPMMISAPSPVYASTPVVVNNIPAPVQMTPSQPLAVPIREGHVSNNDAMQVSDYWLQEQPSTWDNTGGGSNGTGAITSTQNNLTNDPLANTVLAPSVLSSTLPTPGRAKEKSFGSKLVDGLGSVLLAASSAALGAYGVSKMGGSSYIPRTPQEQKTQQLDSKLSGGTVAAVAQASPYVPATPVTPVTVRPQQAPRSDATARAQQVAQGNQARVKGVQARLAAARSRSAVSAAEESRGRIDANNIALDNARYKRQAQIADLKANVATQGARIQEMSNRVEAFPTPSATAAPVTTRPTRPKPAQARLDAFRASRAQGATTPQTMRNQAPQRTPAGSGDGTFIVGRTKRMPPGVGDGTFVDSRTGSPGVSFVGSPSDSFQPMHLDDMGGDFKYQVHL